MHLLAELFGNDAAHYFEQIFASFFGDEGVLGLGPAELEAGGKGGDPDFADGGVWRNDELGFLGFLEDDFKLAAFPFDVETVLVAEIQKTTLEIVEGGVGFSLEVLFVEHGVSVSQNMRSG